MSASLSAVAPSPRARRARARRRGRRRREHAAGAGAARPSRSRSTRRRTSTTWASTPRSPRATSPPQGIKPVILPYANALRRAADPGRPDRPRHQLPARRDHQQRQRQLRYRAVGALVTDNTTALAVLASSKYTRPAQLSGKIYGGFGIASDKPLVTSIMRADGVAHPVFKQVVLGTDVITALAAHRDRLHRRLRRHRRRHRGAAGRQAAHLPLQPLPGRRRRLPQRRLRRERQGHRRARADPRARAEGARRGLRVRGARTPPPPSRS